MSSSPRVVVIGSGPVGLFSLFECGMLGFRCNVFDALTHTGGQCFALYPEKPIYDIPAHPEISGANLIDQLLKQCEPFAPSFHLGEQVILIKELEEKGRLWLVEGSKGTKIECQAIIIAAGVGAFGPHKPPLPNIEKFEESSVHYYVKKREDYRGKKILIAGGGDSAVDWALSLYDIASSLTIIHRRSKFKASPESERQLKALAEEGKITLLTPYQLFSLEGESGVLSSVTVMSLEGTKETIETDVLLPFFGLSMNLGPILEWNLGIEKKHILVDQSTMKTSRPGIYAIGDIAHYPNKLKLILTGFAEAAQAAHHIRHHIFPNEIFHFEYSTTQGLPKA